LTQEKFRFRIEVYPTPGGGVYGRALMGDYVMDVPENRDKLLNLLKTTRGQIDAVIGMIDDTKQCTDILVQLLSAQGLLKKCTIMLLENRIKNCLNEAVKNAEDRENKINEIISILSKLSKA